MFGLGPATKVYLALGATDMRKGFDGIYGLVRDPLSCERSLGAIFSIHSVAYSSVAGALLFFQPMATVRSWSFHELLRDRICPYPSQRSTFELPPNETPRS